MASFKKIQAWLNQFEKCVPCLSFLTKEKWCKEKILLQKASVQLGLFGRWVHVQKISVLLCVFAYNFVDYDYNFYAVKEINEL